MLRPEEIIVSVLHFIAQSDNVTQSEKSIINSYINSQGFFKIQKVKKNFITTKHLK